MAGVARGDRVAFRDLYAATAPKLNGVILRILGDRARAEECLQEVYVRVWRSADRYESGKGTVMTWLIAVARNAALDRRRRERPTQPLEDTPHLAMLRDDTPDPFQQASSSQDAMRLKACLERLDPEPRQCIQLAYWHGLTQEELSRKLNHPLGTIKSWVRRSLMRLKECLAA